MTRVYYGTHSDGLRYAARDKPGRHHRSERCEHAIWGKTNEHQTNHVVWVTHEEGGRMRPFLGPDDAWDEITKGGVHLWKHAHTASIS